MRTLPLLIVLLAFSGCTAADGVEEEGPRVPYADADSIAAALMQATGEAALSQVGALRFDFAIEQDGDIRRVAHHLYDPMSGRFRAEWPAGAARDSVYVVLFEHWPDRGTVYRGGSEVSQIDGRDALEIARRRTINDSYWLLAPLKVNDPGVIRTYEPDSSSTEHAVIRLSFEDVGLTPGDQYWLFVNRETGLLDRWTYLLQSATEPRSHRWTDEVRLSSTAGDLRLATRKESLAGGASILTNQLSAISDPAEDWFSDPLPRLEP